MSDFVWRPVSEVPPRPTAALFATFDEIVPPDDGPFLLDGLFIVQKGAWVREDGRVMPSKLDNVWWIEEEALFAAWPLKRLGSL